MTDIRPPSPTPPVRSCQRTGDVLRAVLLCLGMAVAGLGCSRAFWRTQADQDVYDVLAEHLTDPRWAVPRTEITADPASRFFDSDDPDCPPLPPDDPAAHALMHCVDGWEGFKGWHRFGDSLSIENPHWLARFGIDPNQRDPETGQYVGEFPEPKQLTLPMAIELAMIHNRDYQSRIEELYFAALDATFERFQFGVRYLGVGRREPGADMTFSGGPGGVDQFRVGSRFGVSQLLPFGGQLAAELANNTVWLFSGGQQTSTASTLSFQLVQPLLLNAGRPVFLEALTQTERELLYEARTLARFRQTFFADLAGADGGGYFALLVRRQNIQNERAFIRRLQRQIEALEEYVRLRPPGASVPLVELPAGAADPARIDPQLSYDAAARRLAWSGPMSPDQEQRLRLFEGGAEFRIAAEDLIQAIREQEPTLDFLQLRSTLADSVNRLRNLELNFADAFDAYKVRLGLPTDFPIELDEEYTQSFRLISTVLMELDAEGVELSRLRARLNDPSADHSQIHLLTTRLETVRRRMSDEAVDVLRQDFEVVTELLPERAPALDTPEEAGLVDFDLDRDRRLFERSVAELDGLGETLVQVEGRLELLSRLEPLRLGPPQAVGVSPTLLRSELRSSSLRLLDVVRERLQRLVQLLEIVQIGLRLEMIAGRPFAMSLDEATRTALLNRFELMNARARVMDARRRVEIIANDLQAAVDVVAGADVRTPTGTSPFDFRARLTNLRAGLSLTAPLDQIGERNAYRAVLINYQRARREYMRTEDVIKQEVRGSWRQVQVTRRNLDTWRRAVRIASTELDAASVSSLSSRDRLQPLDAGLRGTVIVNALQRVLAAQNNLITTWIDSELSRLRVHRDMGDMVIDEQGVWVDPFYQALAAGGDLYDLSRAAGEPSSADAPGRAMLDDPPRLDDPPGLEDFAPEPTYEMPDGGP